MHTIWWNNILTIKSVTGRLLCLFVQYKIQKKTGKTTIPQDEFSANISREKEEIEKLEEIVYRLVHFKCLLCN